MDGSLVHRLHRSGSEVSYAQEHRAEERVQGSSRGEAEADDRAPAKGHSHPSGETGEQGEGRKAIPVGTRPAGRGCFDYRRSASRSGVIRGSRNHRNTITSAIATAAASAMARSWV